MCFGEGDTKTDTPASDLAALMRRHMRCNVSPENLERFLTNHWAKVSFLAHKVHEGKKRHAA